MIAQVLFIVFLVGVVVADIFIVVPLFLLLGIPPYTFLILLHLMSVVMTTLGGSSGTRRPHEYNLYI